MEEKSGKRESPGACNTEAFKIKQRLSCLTESGDSGEGYALRWRKAILRTCPVCAGKLIKHGFLKKEHTQRYRCKNCAKTYSDAEKRQFGVFRLQPEKITQTITLITEGTSIRASSRIVGIHRDTVLSILKFAGTRAEMLLKRKLVDIEATHIEVDELWTFVQKKEQTYADPETDNGWTGDYYTFLGMESHTKLMFLPLVGKRTETNTKAFMKSLADSLKNRTQVTTDGFPAYRAAVKEAFNGEVDYAQYYKEYNMLNKKKRGSFVNRMVSPSERKNLKDRYQAQTNGKPYLVRCGAPSVGAITTSRIERANLTVRTANKRFNRATICFSRSEEYLHYAVMLFTAHYNFVKLHSSLGRKTTPAMAAGLADRVWKTGDLLLVNG